MCFMKLLVFRLLHKQFNKLKLQVVKTRNDGTLNIIAISKIKIGNINNKT